MGFIDYPVPNLLARLYGGVNELSFLSPWTSLDTCCRSKTNELFLFFLKTTSKKNASNTKSSTGATTSKIPSKEEPQDVIIVNGEDVEDISKKKKKKHKRNHNETEETNTQTSTTNKKRK